LRPTGYALSLFCARISLNFNPATGTRVFFGWGKVEKNKTTSTSTGLLALSGSLGKYLCLVCLEAKQDE
jgi:hypothetical protein